MAAVLLLKELATQGVVPKLSTRVQLKWSWKEKACRIAEA